MNRAQPEFRFGHALAVLLCLVVNLVARGGETTTRPRLQDALAKLKVPPDWMAATQTTWDEKKPWKEARLEVRRLLALDEAGVRQGIKLTWLYARKNDIGDGHELPMYLFMGGEYAWALQEYTRFIQTVKGKGATHAYLCCASCYAHFGEFDKAIAILNEALKDLPPKPWQIANTAHIDNNLGDLYAQKGDTVRAKQFYQEAIRLYPTSDQPYGRHLLPRNVAKVQTKLNLLTMESLRTAQLRDGTYVGKTLGYVDTPEMEVSVTVTNGKIADIKVKHSEKIDLGAADIIPKRIVEKQSLKVDAITGATVTSQAVVDGAFQALKQAGLK